jgi:hypothetical protein
MKARILVALMLALPFAANAQTAPPDPALLQHAANALQAQRNQAMDAAAIAEARAAGLADDLAKAQARIKELEPKPEAPATAK